ncbi:MAG: Methyltransferase type 11 [Bacteroidetes bacterium]|nr:Methyltransferase type 11 [Bacteroidota bacterium]
MEEKRFNPDKLDRLNHPDRIYNFPVLEILDMIGVQETSTVVDIGAGTAFYSKPIAEKFPNCTIIAADISDLMIQWMEENIVSSFPNIHTLKMEDHRLPLETGSVDFTFMVNLHHELDTPELNIQECYRILKKGGYLAISDWRKEQSDKGPSYDLRYDPITVMSQLLASGFIVVFNSSDYPDNFVILAVKN